MTTPIPPPDSTTIRPPVLELRGITKRFPGILANDHVDLTLRRGEILALLGENGAGKSTLMNIIYGLYHADEGEIWLRGEKATFASPRAAIRSGIGMVHQHFQLVPVMTVAENIALGEEKASLEADQTARESESDLATIANVVQHPDLAVGGPVVRGLRIGWGYLWRALTPLVAVGVGLLVGQIVLQLIYVIGTYLVSEPQFRSFTFERLPLAVKGLNVYAALYQTQPTLVTILLWLPLVAAIIAGGAAMFALGRHARNSWRGSSSVAVSSVDSIVEALIDYGSTITSVLNRRQIARRVGTISKNYGLELDPNALIETLPVGLQQRVEIVKALYRKADILILDEPTAVLTPQEAQELFKVMRELAGRGVSIIFISHKLKEVLQIADQVVVMRGGKVVGNARPKESTEASLASMMVGRSVMLKVAKEPAKPGSIVLRVDNLTADDDRKSHALQGVNFEVRAGEVLGIAGVQGNGQTELVEVLSGLRPAKGGSFRIAGELFEKFTPRQVTNAGSAHIPEDRQRYGMVSTYSVADNLILNHYEDAPFAAPPIPRRIPLAAIVFGVIFLAVFVILGQVWSGAIYPSVAVALGLTNPDITPRTDPLRFITGLIMTILVGLIAAAVGYLVANLITSRINLGAAAEGGITINQSAVDANATEKVRQFDIRTPGIRVNAGSLSGGNQQKLVVAREFGRKPRLLIASQPTRGIDVGSIEFIHQQIIAQRDTGTAVLLVSAELDEIMALSDRIAIMFHGQVIATIDAAEATREQIGLLMAGIRDGAGEVA